MGIHGLRVTLGKFGTRLTAGLPGSGMSMSKHISRRSPKEKPKSGSVGQRLLEKALRDE